MLAEKRQHLLPRGEHEESQLQRLCQRLQPGAAVARAGRGGSANQQGEAHAHAHTHTRMQAQTQTGLVEMSVERCDQGE